MTETIVVTTTLETRDDAERLALVLLKKRLIACAQIDTEIQSLYWWQGCVEQGAECRLTMKTTKGSWQRLEREIVLNHPYDTPEIIAIAAEAVHEKYAKWLVEELQNE